MSENEIKPEQRGALGGLSPVKRPYTPPTVQDFIDEFAVFGTTGGKGQRRQRPPQR